MRPRISCPDGCFEGYETERAVHVRGIRYAVSRRYEPPVSYRYPEGVHLCVKSAPFALQTNSKLEYYLTGLINQNVRQEESAQYLSVHMPKHRTEALPVMVWFHGGGFRHGGCDSAFYDFEPLVTEQNVIVVGVNYRLGIAGFTRDGSGNLGHPGLLDAIEALRWIQRNIASFFGDPENVVLFGQSAGAELVRCILLSEGTEELYRRAILQSDPIGAMENRSQMDEEILQKVNEVDPYCSTEQLNRLQTEILSSITEKGNGKYMVFAPHFGIWPLPEWKDVEARLRSVAASHELLIGCTTREVAVYGGQIPVLRSLDMFFLTRPVMEKILHKLSDSVFCDPSASFAEAYAEAGGKVYEYSFFWRQNEAFIACGHMADLVLLFGGSTAYRKEIGLGLSAKELNESGKPMRRIWGEFARTGCAECGEISDVMTIRRLD